MGYFLKQSRTYQEWAYPEKLVAREKWSLEKKKKRKKERCLRVYAYMRERDSRERESEREREII